ncbi:hypothetical protein NXC24_CH03233 [Rhizobium sp. NXC24]|nr:hypothetical protein NXC24_CH03233 [Rhizobium sp. NXC24]
MHLPERPKAIQSIGDAIVPTRIARAWVELMMARVFDGKSVFGQTQNGVWSHSNPEKISGRFHRSGTDRFGALLLDRRR